MLTTDTETEVVADTTVGLDLLQALKVITELRVDVVGKELAALAVNNVALPVQEPGGDLELGGVLEDGNNALELVRVELTSTLAKVDIGLLADNVGVSTTNTLDLSKGVLDLDLAVNVGVEQTVPGKSNARNIVSMLSEGNRLVWQVWQEDLGAAV